MNDPLQRVLTECSTPEQAKQQIMRMLNDNRDINFMQLTVDASMQTPDSVKAVVVWCLADKIVEELKRSQQDLLIVLQRVQDLLASCTTLTLGAQVCNDQGVSNYSILNLTFKVTHLCSWAASMVEVHPQQCQSLPDILVPSALSLQSYNLLTVMHSDLIKVCLLCRQYTGPAVDSLIQTDFTSVSVNNDALHIVSYFYYAAIVCMRRSDFSRAKRLLEHSISVPGSSASIFSLEALKKHLLLSLLLGIPVTKNSWPRSTSMAVHMLVKPLCAPYTEFAMAYQSTLKQNPIDIAQLQAVAEKHQQIFRDDGNFALIERVARELYAHKLMAYTRVFTQVSISTLKNLCGLVNDEKTVLCVEHCIRERDLNAVLDESRTNVSFAQYGTSLLSSAEKTSRINTKMETIKQLKELTQIHAESMTLEQLKKENSKSSATTTVEPLIQSFMQQVQ